MCIMRFAVAAPCKARRQAGRYFHDILFLFRFSFIPLQPESKSCFLRGAAVVAAAEIIPMNLIRVMPA